MYHSRKYKVNEHFLDNWSAEMAYVLGFWFADGYMRKEKSYRILFISNDAEILNRIRQMMRSENPIIRRTADNAWEFNIHSKHMFDRLGALGGTRGKSRNMHFPKVPQKFRRDFIRGYFDGDGSVFFAEYLSTKNGKPRRELRSNFTSGSRAFLTDLMNILHAEIGLTKKTLGVYNNGGSLKLGYATKDTRKLLNFLYYQGHTIGMDRKAKFLNAR